jgi:hypothetical protein
MNDIMDWTGQKTYGEVKKTAEDWDIWRLVVANLRFEVGRCMYE